VLFKLLYRWLTPVILTCLAITLAVYAILSLIIRPGNETRLITFLQFQGVFCHHWSGIPSLPYFGDFNLPAR
ncbi:MAG TPA: hypothetical protein DCO83_07420, partial [Mucilaginibacter sp.]|nr:hypothetical protein [Mucilaginibacter sp.]